MISENYKNALIEELAEEHDLPCDYVEDVLENEELTGNWTEDKAKVSMKLVRSEESPVNESNVPELAIEEIVDSLHIGFNYVPGVGAGYCSDEQDLMKMKEFVRGALVAMEMMKGMLG